MRSLLIFATFAWVASLSSCGDKLECNKSVGQSVLDAADQTQLQQDIANIDAYIAANNVANVQELNGVKFVITQEGRDTGTPCLENSVVVAYVGRRLDGVIFDQSTGISLKLNGLIVGWQIMFPTFREGTKARLFIPSVYAYGASGRGNSIPPNTSLIFDVELISIR